MADTPQTTSLLALGQFLRGDIVAQINRRSALLRILPIKPGIGQNCAWAVEGDGALVENFAEGADAANFGSDSQLQALLSWARVRSNFHVVGSARRAAESAMAGPGGVKDLVGRNMRNSSSKVASNINLQLYSGTGANQIVGLDTAIGNATATYATIDRTVSPANTFWVPTVSDPGSPTALTFQQVRADRTAIFKLCGEMPDFALCSPEVFDTFGSLFDANRHYISSVMVPARSTQPITLDGGFEGIELDGMVFIKDKDATQNQIYYINSNYIEIQAQLMDPPGMAELGVTAPANDGYGTLPLGIRTEKLAKNGDSDRYMVMSELQLVVRRCNAMGVRKNILLAT